MACEAAGRAERGAEECGGAEEEGAHSHPQGVIDGGQDSLPRGYLCRPHHVLNLRKLLAQQSLQVFSSIWQAEIAAEAEGLEELLFSGNTI